MLKIMCSALRPGAVGAPCWKRVAGKVSVSKAGEMRTNHELAHCMRRNVRLPSAAMAGEMDPSQEVYGHSGKAVANLLLDWSAQAQRNDVTPLKLQKLLFFCHADFLLETGRHLIKDDFEAWRYGPVIPSVYEEFKIFGNGPISKAAKTFDPITGTRKELRPNISNFDSLLLRDIFGIYVSIPGGILSNLSHIEGGPWHHALLAFDAGANINRRISADMIRTFHRAKRS